MIRQPGSKYERTRSKTLLKIKKFHDAEVCIWLQGPPKIAADNLLQIANKKRLGLTYHALIRKRKK